MPYWKKLQDPAALEQMPFKLAKKQERNLLFQAILKNDLREESDVESDDGIQYLNKQKDPDYTGSHVDSGAGNT